MSENGKPPAFLNPDQLQLIAEDTLRTIDHIQWLRQLAVVLEQAPERRGIPMSPFRAGAIERIRLCVKYIELLQREARDNARHIAGLEDDLKELKLDRDIDRHEESR